MLIKKAARKDLKNVGELMLKEFKKPPFNERVSIDAVLKSLDFYFKIGHILIAISENKIVGVIVFKFERFWEGKIMLIEDLVVLDKFRSKGVGSALLNKTESIARKNKIKSISIHTNRKSSAVGFYIKRGYRIQSNVVLLAKHI